MIFAEFQHDSTGWNGKDFTGPVTLIPCCGSDGVFKLDARKSLANQIEDAHKRVAVLNASRVAVKGFRIFRSPSWRYSAGKPITEIIPARL